MNQPAVCSPPGERRPGREFESFSVCVEIVGPVFYNPKFSDKAKLLYGLIVAMSRAPKYYAYAHNDTMAKFLNCSERTLQRTLDELVKAGEIQIDDSQGGRKTIRKIRAVRFQPFNHDTGDVVNHDTDVVVTNNSINYINSIKGKGKSTPVSEQEIIDWLDRWATDLNEDQETTVKLIGDLHAFVECRKAKGKPILTINAAGRHAARLLAYSADYPDQRVAAMRYMLSESIEHNWEKIFPISDQKKEDFFRWLRDNYGVPDKTAEAPADYF